jgi:uncharacterized protein YidB (DUF937 family)
MKRGMPSMMALLGLLAVAGYQNRDKISEMMKGAGQGGSGGLGGLLGSLGNLFGGDTNPESVVNEGLGGLIDHFKEHGQGEKADSWVKTGPNEPISADELEKAIDPGVLDTLIKQTGLTKDELLARLSRTLPEAVDKYTPEGKLPDATAA